MVKIPRRVQEFLVRKNGWVATATPFGTPTTALKASIEVIDDEHIIFADLFSRKKREDLRSYSKVVIAVADTATGKGYEIKGSAEMRDSGPLFEQVSEKLKVALIVLPPLKYVVDIAVESVYDLSVGPEVGVQVA